MRYTATHQTQLRLDAICEHTGANAGYIQAAITPDQIFIEALDVAQSYRRAGIARQLLTLMLFRLSGAQYRDREVYIKVAPYHDEPISWKQLAALYSQYGFITSNKSGYMKLERPASAPHVPYSPKQQVGLEYTVKHLTRTFTTF